MDTQLGRERLLRALEAVATTPRESGQGFFEALVLRLADVVGARCALVAEPVPGRAGRVRSLAHAFDGALAPPVEYELSGTPCEGVFGAEACYYARGVSDRFPEDAMLREFGAESYIGTPLRSGDGSVFGVLMAIHDAPLEEHPPPALLLELFAVRASSELDRLRAERERARVEERTRHALAGSGVVVWDWDTPTDSVSWVAVEPLFGLEPGVFGGTVEAFLDLIVPEDRTAVADAIARCSAGGSDHLQVTYRALRGDGSLCWLEATGRATRAADGTLLRLAGTVKDVSGTKAVLEDLRAERATLSAVLDTTVMAVVVLNTRGDIVYANERAEGILGLKRSEIMRRSYDAPEWRSTDVDGGPWPDEKQPFVRVLTTRQPVFGVRHAIEWPSGQRKVLSINGAPILDAAGEVTSLVFAIEDVTESSAAERELRESRERFRQYFEQSLIGIAVSSPDHAYLEANLKLCELMGTTLEDLGDSRLDELVHPDDREAFTSALARLEAGKVPNDSAERRLLRRDGSAVPVLISTSAVRDATGHLRYLLSLVLDLSERKRLEEQLLHSQKLEGIGRFAGGVAHDFNNLLTAILSYADLAESLTEDPEVREMLVEIRDGGQRAADLTRQLLAFASRQMITPRVLDLNALVRSVARLLGRVLGEDVRLELALRPDLWTVRADPGQLEQILMNLAANARDAMPEGGVFSIGSRNAALSGPAAHLDLAAGDYVELVVADTGMGMDEPTRRLVFEPFFTTKGLGRGSGLGLATCHGIVQQAGGRITVESAPGRGTVFRILLPRCAETADTVAQPRPAQAAGGDETLLVVEDDDAVRRVAVRTLIGLGYRVHEAGSPSEALDRARGLARLHLVLCDVVLPEASGPQLAVGLRQLHPEARVLFTSGYNEEVLDQHHAADLAELLPKPYQPAALASRVRELLDRE